MGLHVDGAVAFVWQGREGHVLLENNVFVGPVVVGVGPSDLPFTLKPNPLLKPLPEVADLRHLADRAFAAEEELGEDVGPRVPQEDRRGLNWGVLDPVLPVVAPLFGQHPVVAGPGGVLAAGRVLEDPLRVPVEGRPRRPRRVKVVPRVPRVLEAVGALEEAFLALALQVEAGGGGAALEQRHAVSEDPPGSAVASEGGAEEAEAR
mmetsp:Transcript_10180/g.28793  ORF Transcript_10180/g.28793 Transcript_10180/m.28793 type:complete len:206 (-) Transcript_10180:108-725(-)